MGKAVSFIYWVQSAVEEHITCKKTIRRIITMVVKLPARTALVTHLSQSILRERKGIYLPFAFLDHLLTCRKDRGMCANVLINIHVS